MIAFAELRFLAIKGLLSKAIDEPALRRPVITCLLKSRYRNRKWDPIALLKLLKLITAEEESLAEGIKTIILKNPNRFPKKDVQSIVRSALGQPNLRALAISVSPGILPKTEVRAAFVDALSDKSTVIVSAGLDVLLNDFPDEVSKYSECIIDAVKSKNRQVRMRACQAFALIPRALAEVHLIKLLDDPERIVRREALISFVKVCGSNAITHMILALRDPAPLVRIEACIQLRAFKAEQIADALIERLDDAHEKVRSEAFKSLWAIDPNLANANFDRIAAKSDRYVNSIISELDAPTHVKRDLIRRSSSISPELHETLSILSDSTIYEDNTHYDGYGESSAYTVEDEIKLYQDGYNGIIDTNIQQGIFDKNWFIDGDFQLTVIRLIYSGKLFVGACTENAVATDHYKSIVGLLLNDGHLNAKHRSTMNRLLYTIEQKQLLLDDSLLTEILDLCHKDGEFLRIASQALCAGILEAFHRMGTAEKELFPRGFDQTNEFGRLLFKGLSENPPDDSLLVYLNRVDLLDSNGELRRFDYDPIPNSTHWMPITPNLRSWGLALRTPFCIGYLLRCGGPSGDLSNPLRLIPAGKGTPKATTELIKRYSELDSSTLVSGEIYSRWMNGSLKRTDPEVEVLYGIGDKSIMALYQRGQTHLFID